MTTIVRAILTCSACPSQWDAWDADGSYWYLRYRFGRGTATCHPGLNERTLKNPELSFSTDDDLGGTISLTDFCRLAGLQLDRSLA